MEIENYEPRHFDWAAKNLQVLISQCNGKRTRDGKMCSRWHLKA